MEARGALSAAAQRPAGAAGGAALGVPQDAAPGAGGAADGAAEAAAGAHVVLVCGVGVECGEGAVNSWRWALPRLQLLRPSLDLLQP